MANEIYLLGAAMVVWSGYNCYKLCSFVTREIRESSLQSLNDELDTHLSYLKNPQFEEPWDSEERRAYYEMVKVFVDNMKLDSLWKQIPFGEQRNELRAKQFRLKCALQKILSEPE